MRVALIPCLIVAVLMVAPAHAAIDGKVAGLNETAFTALATVKKRNPGSLTERDAQELAAAIMADQNVDDSERDLLEEMTQSQFRNITVRPADDSGRAVMSFPTVGNAKKVLQRVLKPELDLDAEWTQGSSGWADICNEFKKSPDQEARVVAFIQGKLSGQWELSNMGNGYKAGRLGRIWTLFQCREGEFLPVGVHDVPARVADETA